MGRMMVLVPGDRYWEQMDPFDGLSGERHTTIDFGNWDSGWYVAFDVLSSAHSRPISGPASWKDNPKKDAAYPERVRDHWLNGDLRDDDRATLAREVDEVVHDGHWYSVHEGPAANVTRFASYDEFVDFASGLLATLDTTVVLTRICAHT